jgi:hypothetical protein
MTPTVEKIIARAKAAGIDARYWEKSGKFRIYAQVKRRDAKIFLDLDDADASGAAFKIFIDDCGQATAWYASQKGQLRETFKPLFFAYVVERYADTPAAPNGYGLDINEMIDEARAYFAGVEAAE